MNRREFLESTCLASAGAILPKFGSMPIDAEEKPSTTEAGSQNELFVAVSGDDRNPGTKQEPFATIARAKEAVRELKKRSHKAIIVWVRRGTYYVSDPLVFEPRDSGTEAPITYAAYPGELVTLSGGRKLTGQWKPYKDGIMVCEV